MSNRPFNVNYSHSGVCVADMDRAKAFYMNGLGFKEAAAFNVGNECQQLLGLDSDIDMLTQMMVLDHFVVELIKFETPSPVPAGGLNPMNRTGLTHLSFTVEDVDAAAVHLEACGAHILHETRTTIPLPNGESTELVFCTDPDGTRIEIYQPPASMKMTG